MQTHTHTHTHAILTAIFHGGKPRFAGSPLILCNQDNHRLNGSSSPVLTATPHSYGKGQNSTPYKIKTPERIGMKLGTVDYVLDISPQNKFGDDRSSGGFWVNM